MVAEGPDPSNDLTLAPGWVTINSQTQFAFSGSIEIAAKGWQPNQTIDIDTFSGNVALHVPETARGTVSFNSFSGLVIGRMLGLKNVQAMQPADERSQKIDALLTAERRAIQVNR